MKRTDELEKLFADARLEPNRRFVRGLRGQLISPKKRRVMSLQRLGLQVLLPAVMIVAAVLVLVATPLQSTPERSKGAQSASTVLMSKLYGVATADALPQHSAITFWDITDTSTTGPAAATCHNLSEDSSTRSMLFRDGNVTASWGKHPDGTPSMLYSEDPEMPASGIDAPSASNDLTVQSTLQYGTLSDEHGKPLAEDAKTALKATGTYDLYTTQNVLSRDGGKPSCPVQFTHMRIDAASGMLTEIGVYNGTMADDNLIYKEVRTISTGTGDFAAELPKLTAVGFNLAQAKTQLAQLDTAHVRNVAGGYQFTYFRSVFGMDTLSQVKAADGSVAAYSYHFAKQPKVVYKIYTSKAGNQQPKDLAALKAMGQAKGWQVWMDDKNPPVAYQGYPKAPTEMYMATDGTTEYGMFATGTPDLPYVYVEAPVAVQDVSWLLRQTVPFAPGTY